MALFEVTDAGWATDKKTDQLNERLFSESIPLSNMVRSRRNRNELYRPGYIAIKQPKTTMGEHRMIE